MEHDEPRSYASVTAATLALGFLDEFCKYGEYWDLQTHKNQTTKLEQLNKPRRWFLRFGRSFGDADKNWETLTW